MTQSITKVALAGATGNIGSAILTALVEAKFQVVVLTRKGTEHKFPSSVTVSHVDYDSVDSLVEALKGTQAVISTLASLAIATQLNLVTAASKAGVQRFIPSEFGSNLDNAKTRALPVYGDKVKVQESLKQLASSPNGMTYTLMYTGPFLDFGLRVGFIFPLKAKTVDLFDGGNRVFSTTTLKSVGKAVAGVLSHPEETKNRAVYVQDTAVTLKQLVSAGQKATGGPEGWKENVVSVDDLLAGAWAELSKEKPNPDNFVFPFLRAGIWGEGYGAHYTQNDNALLGIKEFSSAELQEVVNELAK